MQLSPLPVTLKGKVAKANFFHILVHFNNILFSLGCFTFTAGCFEHREQDVAHFGSPRLTIEKA